MPKLEPIEYLSYGGGTPSAALLYANAVGLVKPRAEIVVFADTGAELPETYETAAWYEEWLADFGVDFVRVQSHRGPLLQFMQAGKYTPIPVYAGEGRSPRVCTQSWKIEPIEQYLHARFGKRRPLIAQLELTRDTRDINRMRDSRVKQNRNRWPLIELGWSRSVCVEVLKEAGLPVPPPSSCYFCPLHNGPTWQHLKLDHPDLFDSAVELDEGLREHNPVPVYLDRDRRPLRSRYGGHDVAQPRLELWTTEAGEECDAGVCDT